MFINESYKNYKYVVSVADNYVVLAKTSSVNADWQNPKTIDVIYQYLNPSFLVIEDTRVFSSSQTFERVDSSQSFFSRADCNSIILSQFLIIFFTIFVLNGLTRFIKKGGVFFGS